jgi:hypothetical protein
MRILHVGNFQQFKYGQWYMSLEQKLSRGMVRLGHCVETFSQRDVARAENPFNSKLLGARKMNRRLLEASDNFRPELVLFGHSELVTDDTLAAMRRLLPGVPFAVWYCDPLFHPRGPALLRRFSPYAAAIFVTTGGPALRAVAHDRCRAAHFPNPVEAATESGNAASRATHDYDLFFAGSVLNEPDRVALLKRLRALPGIRFQIHHAFGQPRIHGRAYYDELERSYAGLSLSRRLDEPWYSSDRLQQLTGNGVLTFSPRTPGLDRLFGADELAWFDDIDDLEVQIRRFLADRELGRQVAGAGRERVHRSCAAERVARYMLEVIYRTPFSDDYEWSAEIYEA